MRKETADKMKKTVDANEDEVLEGEIVESKYNQDTVELTKDRTLEFLRRSYTAVEEDRKLKSKVGMFIEKKLDQELKKLDNNQDTEMTINQAAGLFQLIGTDATAAQDSLLQILKPVPNTINPWIEKRPEDLNMNKAFNDITSKEMQSVNVISDFLTMLAEQGKQAADKKTEEGK